MRILHIITRLIVGGAQQNTVMSCAAQVAAGHQVWLAYGPIYGPEGSLLDEAKASGATLVEVKSMRRSILPGHDWFCYRQLRKLIRQIKPDVVHTHSSKAGILGRAAAWKEKVPAVIHTVHGLPFNDKQRWPVRRAYLAAERWAAKRCHKLVGITQPMVEIFQANDIGKSEQYSVIPSGVAVSKWELPQGESSEHRQQTRRELGLNDDIKVIGLVARIDPLKGHADLLKIAERIAASQPDFRYLFVGGGWHMDHVKALTEQAGLADRVIFTGLVPPEKVADLYRAMDVMVLPSYQEGQSRTLIESLLAGCPIVAYNAGGIRDVCIDQVTGRLVPVGDLDGLAAAITWTLDNREAAARLVEQGRQHVKAKFARRVMCAMLDQLYRDTLEGK